MKLVLRYLATLALIAVAVWFWPSDGDLPGLSIGLSVIAAFIFLLPYTFSADHGTGRALLKGLAAMGLYPWNNLFSARNLGIDSRSSVNDRNRARRARVEQAKRNGKL